MKKALILFVLIASMAFAANSSLGHIDGATPATPDRDDGFLVNNVYDYGALTNGLACYSANGWYLANDFESGPDSGDTIEGWTNWIIDNGAASSIDSMFYDGDASGPGSLLEVIGGTGTLTDTGDDNWGFDLYENVVVMDSAYALTASTYYWMTFDPVGGFYYWLTPDHDSTWGAEAYFSEDGGYSWNSSSATWGQAYDNFWVIEEIGGAVEESTWGFIKAL